MSMHSQLVKADKLKTLIKPELYEELHAPVTPVPEDPAAAVEVVDGDLTLGGLEDAHSLGATTSEGCNDGSADSVEDPLELAKKIAEYEKQRVKNYTRPTCAHIQLFNHNNIKKLKNLQSTTKKKTTQLQSLYANSGMIASSPSPVVN